MANWRETFKYAPMFNSRLPCVYCGKRTGADSLGAFARHMTFVDAPQHWKCYQAARQAGIDHPLVRWEYQHTLLMDVLTYDTILDRFGAQGWELVSTTPDPPGVRCWFKRVSHA